MPAFEPLTLFRILKSAELRLRLCCGLLMILNSTL